MGWLDEVADDTANDLLLDGLGLNVTRYPAGVVADAVTVVAVPVTMPPVVETDYGKSDRIVHRMTLDVKSSVEVDRKDQWLISGKLYQTEFIRDVEAGMRTISLRRDEKIATSGADAGRIR